MWDIPVLRDCILYSVFHKIGPTDLLYSSPAPQMKTFYVFLICFPYPFFYTYVLTECVLSSVLRKIRFGPELPERNCCESPGVPASMSRQYVIDTARKLCMCTSMLASCDFRILQGKDIMSLRAETG